MGWLTSESFVFVVAAFGFWGIIIFIMAPFNIIKNSLLKCLKCGALDENTTGQQANEDEVVDDTSAIISERTGNEENERVLDRLRDNDPGLKKLTLNISAVRDALTPQSRDLIISVSMDQMILQTFEAITNLPSLEKLDITGEYAFFPFQWRIADVVYDLKDIRIESFHIKLSLIFDLVLARPNLKALSIRPTAWRSAAIEDITAMAQVLRQITKVHSLTVEGFFMDVGQGAAFAAAFQGNQTIKTLIMRRYAFRSTGGALSFVEALLHNHSLEMIVFFSLDFNDDSAVSIVRTLSQTPLKVLWLASSSISQNGCTRIVQILKENEHSFTKLELFLGSQNSPWKNEIRLEIEMLTWVAQFLRQDAHTQELLFRTALGRANKVDKNYFSSEPNMLFYLIKAAPDLIAHAIHDGH